MCGIAGFLNPQSGRSLHHMRRDAARMGSALSHRGPDDEGTWVDKHAGVGFAHRRLSILDLTHAGRQPMHSACGRYALISNGEIYNYCSLRKDLERAGCAVRSHGDTEVMLAAISEWGLTKALKRFDGMFAFALWDRHQKLLHLGRDRVGEKPLYYGWSGGVFLFGSELKALRQHPGFSASVDRDALALFLRYAYIPAPYSIYQGIRKVMPGCIVTVSANGRCADPVERVYWSYKSAAERGLAAPFQGSAREAVECLAELLQTSVALRMRADVPVGAFLSGGYDSSTIVSLMRRAGPGKVRTFTLGFDENSEADFARKVAQHLDTEHIDGHVTAADAAEAIPQLPRLYDEPFSDSSQIPTFLISKMARRHVSVILTGDGGDELFCGYDRYQQGPRGITLNQRIQMYRTQVSKWTDPARVIPGTCEPVHPFMQRERWLRTSDSCNQMMYLDAIAYLPDDLLVKLDRAAMAVGLETRVPFLDHRIVEFAWRLPFAMKVNNGERKWILRQILSRDVPPALVDRPKQGFAVPLKSWLVGPLRDWAESLLDERRLRQEGYLDAAAVREKWAQLPSGPAPVKHAIWAVLMFEAWLEEARATDSVDVSSVVLNELSA
jgi:asparagine synthase (glutamine-hydrolysing)